MPKLRGSRLEDPKTGVYRTGVPKSWVPKREVVKTVVPKTRVLRCLAHQVLGVSLEHLQSRMKFRLLRLAIQGSKG